MLLSELSAGRATRVAAIAVHPVVLDSSAIISDLNHRLGQDTPTALIQAARFGGIRLYAAHHVFAEVPRKLGDSDGLRGCFEDREQLFWSEYQPLIHYVDTADLDHSNLTSPRPLHELADRDPDDVPTAVLVTLLGTTLSFSADNDLLDGGWAASRWVAPAQAAHVSATLDCMVAVGPRGLRRLSQRIHHHAKARPGLVVLGGGLLVVLALAWASSRFDSPQDLGRALLQKGRRAGATSAEFALQLAGTRLHSVEQCLTASVSPGGAPEGLYGVARQLAVSPRPLAASELLEVSGDLAQGLSAAELNRWLAAQSQFVEVADGWQLGKTMLGLSPPAADPRLGPSGAE